MNDFNLGWNCGYLNLTDADISRESLKFQEGFKEGKRISLVKSYRDLIREFYKLENSFVFLKDVDEEVDFIIIKKFSELRSLLEKELNVNI